MSHIKSANPKFKQTANAKKTRATDPRANASDACKKPSASTQRSPLLSMQKISLLTLTGVATAIASRVYAASSANYYVPSLLDTPYDINACLRDIYRARGEAFQRDILAHPQVQSLRGVDESRRVFATYLMSMADEKVCRAADASASVTIHSNIVIADTLSTVHGDSQARHAAIDTALTQARDQNGITIVGESHGTRSALAIRDHLAAHSAYGQGVILN